MVDVSDDRDLDPSDIAIIREVYDSESAHETFELELERALEAGCDVIVVEPSRLGDETARWIAVGNCLHKTAVISGLSAVVTGDKNQYETIVNNNVDISKSACSLYEVITALKEKFHILES